MSFKASYSFQNSTDYRSYLKCGFKNADRNRTVLFRISSTPMIDSVITYGLL